MYQPFGQSARSPPPLRHPIPTHPKMRMPEPPSTPGYSSGPDSMSSQQNSAVPGATPRGAYAGASGATGSAATGVRAKVSQVHSGYERISSPSFPNSMDPYSYGPQHRAGPQNPGMQSMGAYANAGPGQEYSNNSGIPSGYASPGVPPGYGGSMPAPSGTPGTRANPMAAGGPQWSSFGADGMPSLGGNGMMNDATTQMGVQFGRHVAQVGGEYMQRNVRV